MKQKRTILSITAHGVADFRRQLDAAIAEAQRVAGIPVLPEAGSASKAALVQALADLIEQRAKDDGRTASALVRYIVLSHLQTDNGRAPAAKQGSAPVQINPS